MMDVVFPAKNEEEFIQMAKKLGIDGLIFVYKNKADFYTGKTTIKIKNALLVEPKNVRKAHDAGALAVCTASREAIERGADIVYDFEILEQKEKTHHRQSGLNQVLCKLATAKKVRIGFSFSTILANVGQKRAMILGRIAQNITFCKKYKTPMKIASFATSPYGMRASEELKSFFQQLGMQQTQQALM